MTYIDRFVGETASYGPTINQRREQLIERIRHFIPESRSIDSMADYPGTDDLEVKLAWVKVLDPRPRIEEPGEIEVQPVLPIEWVEDGSGWSAEPGIQRLVLVGKTSSGEEKPIGHMIFSPEDNYTAELTINTNGENYGQPVDWESADAELWLTIAEAALWEQP